MNVFKSNKNDVLLEEEKNLESNLTKIELGYTTNETDEPQEYAEITETSGRLETNIENDGTIYLWNKRQKRKNY